ncbi:MAG TPA: DUF167 domain-containing protein [Candidatus Nanopelagicales bacterium]
MLTFRGAVHVHPGARGDLVGGTAQTGRPEQPPVLAVRVRARAVDGAATAAVERVLADALGVRPRQVHVVRGGSSRDKLVEVSDPPPDIEARWASLLARPGA